MPAAERQAAVARLQGVKPVIAKNLPRAQWENLNGDIQRKLADAMAPAAQPATASQSGSTAAAQADYADAAAQFNALVPQLRAAREAGDTAAVERLTDQMRPFDVRMRRTQATVQNEALARGAAARKQQSADKYAAEPVGSRQRPSEFPEERGLY